MIDRALDIARLALALGRVERATLHEDGLRRETDTDHTVALALLVGDLADGPLRGRVDLGRAVGFALVHDLVEALCGDTNSINLTADERQAKEAREAAALDQLAARLGPESWIVRTIREYEARACVESRLVHFVDKIAPKLTHAINRGRALHLMGIDPDRAAALHGAQLTRLQEANPDLTELADLFLDAHDVAIYHYRRAPYPSEDPAVTLASVTTLAAGLTLDEARAMSHATGNYIDRKCRKKWATPWRNDFVCGAEDEPTWRALVARDLAFTGQDHTSVSDRVYKTYHVTAFGLIVLETWYRAQVAVVKASGEGWCGVLLPHLEAREAARPKVPR